MTILGYFRNIFKKRSTRHPVEYIEEPRSGADPPGEGNPLQSDLREIVHEIDLSPQQDLENYARGLTVTTESIERWISSGLLMPDEMKVAEKIVKIMRKG